MRANVLIYEWADSWGMLEDVPAGEQRIEAYVNLGDCRSEEEAERQAAAELARFRDGQAQITVGIDPTTGDVPLDDITIGDTADVDGTTARMVAVTFGRDPKRAGRLVYAPQLGDVIESPEMLQRRTAKKMANGTLGGAARSARPPAPPTVHDPDANVRIPTQRVTQAEYDALDPPIDGVLYVIVG